MRTRYEVRLVSNSNKLPDVHEFAALIRAALAALPEYKATTISVTRFADNGDSFTADDLMGPYNDV